MLKTWQTAPMPSKSFISANPNIHPVILRLLFNRDLKTAEQISDFLDPVYSDRKYDPGQFRQMAAAVELIVNHIKSGNKMVVYGDYDADGVTASALLYSVLEKLKAKVDVYIPDRIAEGYGLNKKALNEIIKNDVRLVITVDGGIRNKEEIAHLKENKIDVVLTDHHIPPPNKNDLPDCLIINPHSIGEKYPFKSLAGVGVAYKLAAALIERSKLDKTLKNTLTESCLDLVAIGTVADCVSLQGENRILVKQGLNMLKKTKRLGIVELKKAAGMKPGQDISAWQIGFQLAPRLNAAGRMDHANTSFNLLIAAEAKEALRLAAKLNANNTERQKDTEEISKEVEKQAAKQKNKKIIIGICHLDEELEQKIWNEGVIGLVAGKIADRYYRPTLVITQTQDGYKGSGRSIPEFDLIGAIEECGHLLEKYGGHRSAAGFSLSKKNLAQFTKDMEAIAEKKLKNLDLRPKILAEAEIGLGDIDLFFPVLQKFEPFGQDNERPKFLSHELKILDIINMGADGRHIKLRVKDENSKTFSAVGFGQSETWSHLKIGEAIDMVYYVENNEFNGRSEIQLKIVDIKKH